jgi:hypothetical protein
MTRCDVDQHESCLKRKKGRTLRKWEKAKGPYCGTERQDVGEFEKWGIGVAIENCHWECQLCLKTWITSLKNSTTW